MSTGYCVKCKKFTNDEKDSAEDFIAKNGRKMQRAVCEDCGSKKCRIVKKDVVVEEEEDQDEVDVRS